MEKRQKIVGRAELKLAEAVKAFGYDFRGKVVLDIGSSTGGFTEYALRSGAKKVYAVEKGTKQMKAPLRFDPRVVLMEKTDIFTLRSGPFSGEKCPISKDQDDQEVTRMSQLLDDIDIVLADVSFVSLTKILAHVQKRIAGPKTEYLVMLKPQFEAYPDQLVNGKVKNERMRREIIQKFERWLKENGFVVVKKRDNETTGKVSGNRERFYWLICSR